MEKYCTPKQQLLDHIKAKGGWVNAHAHIDRSFMLDDDNYAQANNRLETKWDLVDEYKRNVSTEQLADNMSRVVSDQVAQGVNTIVTFIDADSVIASRAIDAAGQVRDRFEEYIKIKIAHQPIKGLVDSRELMWFEMASERVDILGGLPERDDKEFPAYGFELHLETLFNKSEETGKPLHIHVDQFNCPTQRDTERVIDYMERNQLFGNVALIHCLSLAAQTKSYRHEIYERIAERKVSVITCPTAWIDSPRTEQLAPTHNSLTPVDEILAYDIPIGIGTDNIADIYKPYTDGDMWTELRFLLEAARIHDREVLVKIATEKRIAGY